MRKGSATLDKEGSGWSRLAPYSLVFRPDNDSGIVGGIRRAREELDDSAICMETRRSFREGIAVFAETVHYTLNISSCRVSKHVRPRITRQEKRLWICTRHEFQRYYWPLLWHCPRRCLSTNKRQRPILSRRANRPFRIVRENNPRRRRRRRVARLRRRRRRSLIVKRRVARPRRLRWSRRVRPPRVPRRPRVRPPRVPRRPRVRRRRRLGARPRLLRRPRRRAAPFSRPRFVALRRPPQSARAIRRPIPASVEIMIST
ncbi:hypothetical protein DFR33_104193 [Bradymonas sediminis]|nr:hypothetical protein DFR33_104193 [Bradymonas sediminis]